MAKAKRPRLNDGEIVAGRYRIDGIVGRGGFGAVYKATQVATNRPVALKILLKNFSNAKVDSKRFKREAALVQRLRHPNVVQLLDFGETEKGQPFIAFELLTGEALGKILKDSGALPLYRAAEIARDVLLALEAAHQLGIVHRDIKPQNVFLLEDGTAKVLDFGIAKAVTGEDAGGTQLTEAGQMIGTPHYMAPEQVRGNGVVPGTDIYALGLVMAEMISGERVVKGNALIDIYMLHIADQPFDFDPKVTGCALFPVITRATKKLVEERYANVSEMIAELRAVLPGMGPGAVQATTNMMPAVEPEAFGSTHEIPPDFGATHEILRSSSPGTGGPPKKEDLPYSSTVLMSAPDFEARARKIEAALAAAKASSHPPALDSTVDMARQAPRPAAPRPAAQSWNTPSSWNDPRSAQPPTSHVVSSAPVASNPVSGQVSSAPRSPAVSSSQVSPSYFGGPYMSTPPPGSVPAYVPSVPPAAIPPPAMSQPGSNLSGEHSGVVHHSGIHSSAGTSMSGLHHSGMHHSAASIHQSGMHAPVHTPPPPRPEMYSDVPESTDGGNRIAWVLLAVAVLALATAGVLIWAPWEAWSLRGHPSPAPLVHRE